MLFAVLILTLKRKMEYANDGVVIEQDIHNVNSGLGE
jgi:hypothetical protein